MNREDYILKLIYLGYSRKDAINIYDLYTEMNELDNLALFVHNKELEFLRLLYG